MPIMNSFNDRNPVEHNLILNLNNPNLTLKEKISQVAKSAIYVDKPYLFYLLVHYSFEEASNSTPTRLLVHMFFISLKIFILLW